VKERGGEIVVTSSIEGPAHVAIVVSDDGDGIPAEMAARLFEPYATTKANGTGLGLAIAQRIAIEHDGELAYLGPASSVPGRAAGARFRFTLPVAGPPPVSELTPMPGASLD
jgi:signal transduction histidine kinase